MKKASIFIGGFLLLLSRLVALEFGGVGNVSAGMGGAGVALKASPYGLYYNPALLSADNKTKFGFSLGVEYRQKNIDKIVGINLSNLASFPQNMEILKTTLSDNQFSIISQNGIVLQLSSAILREEFGSLALGYFGSGFANASFNADPNRLEMIVQESGNYFKFIPNGSGGYTKQITNEVDYQAHSIVYALKQGDAHKVITQAFILSEIPVGYAKTFYFKNSNLNLGLAAKFMNGISQTESVYLREDLDLSAELKKLTDKKNLDFRNTFGIDLGMMYEIDLPKFRYLTFGVVAKNINSPTFKFDTSHVVIKPQYRVGVAYNEKFFTLAFDADILPNEVLNFNYKKLESQMIGGGVKFDLKFFDLRIGAMKDIRQDDGLIFTAGINILGVFDIVVQSGNKLGIDGYSIPRYLNFKIGGSFSF